MTDDLTRGMALELHRVGRSLGVTQAVRQEIERFIFSANLKPGSRLPTEKELAERLGVGRSSIREAMRGLQDVGMIEVVQGKGAFVRGQSQKAIEAHLQFLINVEAKARVELTELRRLLEVGLVRLAAERAGEEDLAAMRDCLGQIATADTTQELVEAGARFHLTVAKAAQNAFIATIYEPVTQAINQLYSTDQRSPEQKEQAVRDHAAIYEAIAAHDPELATRRATEHLSNLDRDFGSGTV